MVTQEEIQFYKTIISELDVVFDVGCQHDNVFDELKPGIEVHLFDPLFSSNLVNEIKDKRNIFYNNYALGESKTSMPFHPAYSSFLLRDDEPKFDDHHEIIVSVDTVLNYCFNKNIKKIDLLKIDTEGFDFEVIKGCGHIIHKIKYVQFEDWTDELTKQILDYLNRKEVIILQSKPKNYVAIL